MPEHQEIGELFIECPAMPVRATWNPFTRKADELYCGDCRLILDTGPGSFRIIDFEITFPTCYVRWQWFGKWLVEAVLATGTTEQGGQIAIAFPPEPVERRGRILVALPVDGSGSVNIDGKWYGITARLPEARAARESLGVWLVEAVRVEGKVFAYGS